MKKTSLAYYLKKLFFGSLAMSLAQASQKLIGLLLLSVFTYYLSPEDFGILAMVTLTMTVLSLIYNPGVVSASARLYYDTQDDIERMKIFKSAYGFFILFPLTILFLSLFIGEIAFRYIFKDFNFYPFGLLAVLLSFFVQPKRIWAQLQVVKYRVPYQFRRYLQESACVILF
jgi:O-antigen/teichoic acid export membrane protein